MKRTIIISVMILAVAVAALSDPVQQQDRRRRDREDKKAVLWPPPKEKKADTKNKLTPKPKKTKLPVETYIVNPPAKPKTIPPIPLDSAGVHDFLEPPTWIQSQTTASNAGVSVDYLNPPNWNKGITASKSPQTVYAAPKVSDLSINSMFGSAVTDSMSKPTVSINTPPLFGHDDYLTKPSYNLNMSSWRSPFTSGDSTYTRVQRQLQGYQSTANDIDRIYQRWLPQGK